MEDMKKLVDKKVAVVGAGFVAGHSLVGGNASGNWFYSIEKSPLLTILKVVT